MRNDGGMKFCDFFQPYITEEIRQRGAGFHAGGRVRLNEINEDEVTAVVRGERIYETWIEFFQESKSVAVQCSCQDDELDHEVCAHVWAVACFLDEKEMPMPGLFGCMIDELDDEDDDFDVDFDIPPLSLLDHPPDADHSWRRAATQINQLLRKSMAGDSAPPAPAVERDLRFEIPLNGRTWSKGLPMQIEVRQRLKNGEWGKWKPLPAYDEGEGIHPDLWNLAATVRSVLRGNEDEDYRGRETLKPEQAAILLPRICATEKLFFQEYNSLSGPVRWDEGAPWDFSVAIVETEDGYSCGGEFERDGDIHKLTEALSVAGGLVLWTDHVSRYQTAAEFEPWLGVLLERPPIYLQREEIGLFLEELGKEHELPPLKLPADLDVLKTMPPAKPKLALLQSTLRDGKTLPARLMFNYQGCEVPIFPEAALMTLDDKGTMGLRNRQQERAAWERLWQLGAKEPSYFDRTDAHVVLSSKKLPEIVATLTNEGWEVCAQEKIYRSAASFNISVSSGIDWFDLQANCDFGGQTASLPALLQAARKKENWVELDDGTYGILPEEWLKKWAPLATLGEMDGDAVRFKTAQAGLLDAWLASQPDVNVDEKFKEIRQRLASFGSVEAGKAPRGFTGTLRHYQEEGLGWFEFLREFGLGGCLADDMGLGKTVQMLALLESRRTQRKKNKWPPSLIVVPRSLMFNWMDEARRFTPRLRILDHTGTERELQDGWQNKYDAVLTTYGTLRRDIGILKEIEFDYVVLDESQAIKNAVAMTTKSVRLLKAQHRLAMSGTPIENHLGELWSLMEFLNPGLLGASTHFATQWGNNPTVEQRTVLAKAMRPFILRRTKGQVASELPDRQEDTLRCELLPAQQRSYNELLEHYRTTLLQKVSNKGFNQSKIHVLEALLRLRQAACHPALVSNLEDDTSSCGKFDVLLPRLEELIEEGHKALIFSQFTSFLALLKTHLNERCIVYEYLDGKTKDRQSCVQRFQENPRVPLFLISLKAGGLGLNLTAADYVFLLDPWWNPAVEAQAIDRAHRIGQVNKVMAYRLIATGTVEEKVLELQKSKRELADAILSEDKAFIKNLTRDDLELLLS